MEEQPPYQPTSSEDAVGDINAHIKNLALQNIQAALKGNGIKPESVVVTSYRPEAIEFAAVTTLTPDSNISIKRQAGKITSGKLLDNAGMFNQETAKEIAKITRSPDVISRIKDEIIKREDKGLALEGEYLTLPFLHRDFVAHEPCQSCRAKGKITCNNCGGKGEENCPACHARGTQTCPTCSGRQYIQGPNGQQQHCQRCNGSGHVSCMRCHEARTVQCRQCGASGSLRCDQCNAHGVVSVIGNAAINMIGNYDYDKTKLNEKAAKVVENLNADIQHHAFIGVVERPKETEKQTEDVEIFYHIKAPTADIEFTIKDKLKVPAYMFGKLGALYETPYFLEKILNPGIKSLKTAAMGQGDVAQHIRKAGRYRTLRELILITAKTNPQKALEAILEKNPIGLSEDNAKKMIMLAQRALKLIGKRPRQMGYMIGALSALGMGAAYYLALRSTLPTNIPQMAFDGIAGLCACTIGYMISDIYAKNAIHKSLENLFTRR